jgi:hypothetical protein
MMQVVACRAPAGGHLHKVAHDSGDGMTIFHCPFCGSGQVIARSDRTIECQFCSVCFTVQVQPQFPAFPQTIDGQPVQVPGMPGQIGTNDGMGMDPNADPGAMGAPVDPDAVGEDGEVPEEDPEAAGGAEDDDDDAPPWAKQSMYVTASGHALPPREYFYHLAIKHADDPEEMKARVKAARGHGGE